ncbi:MAG: tetratricopeptide repeat protein [bacterium]|nr:tetratricopeptide repeat protein [bacterium]
MLPPWGRNHLLGGDLQNIVGCCLAKDPARRYPAVDAMLDDLRRAEAGEPIRARAPTRRYLLAKFARRNRVAVTGAGLVVAALLAGLLATAWQARRAARETARAEQVHTFLLDLFAAADPATTRGRDVTARELLLRGSRELRTERAAQPELRAELLVTVGELLRQVGALADADTVLSAALRQAEQAHGRDSPEVGRVADALGGVVYELGRFEDAGALHARALAIHERVHGRRHRVTAGSLANLAGVLSQTGEAERGEALYREVLDIDRTLLGPADAAVATDLNNLAVCLYRAGRSAEADTLHEQALVLRRRLHGDAHPDVATSFHNRAAVLEDLGNAAAAEAHYRRALAIRRELYPQGHIDIAGTLTGLGTLLRDEGRLDEARALLVEAAEVNRTALAGPHLELGRCSTRSARWPIRAGTTTRPPVGSSRPAMCWRPRSGLTTPAPCEWKTTSRSCCTAPVGWPKRRRSSRRSSPTASACRAPLRPTSPSARRAWAGCCWTADNSPAPTVC